MKSVQIRGIESGRGPLLAALGKTVLRAGFHGSAFAVVVVLVGCFSKAASDAKQEAQRTAAVPVTVTNAVARDIPQQLTGIGTVRAYSTVSVKSQNKGTLARVAFEQGDEVHADDLIFLIDPKPFQVALDQVKANLTRDRALLEKAEADFRRSKDLLADRIVSQADFDQSRASVDSLKATIGADEAAVTNAQVQLGYCYIKSPITGRAGTLLVNEGNIVKDIDTVLVVINQIKPIYVDFSIPQQNLPSVRERMNKGNGPLKVEAAIPDYPGRHAEGRLLLVNNEVDATTGTVLLRAEFPNADELLWPGQFVNATLTLSVEHNAVVVPSLAVQLGQTNRFVCVVKADDTVEFRSVEVSGSYGQMAIVKKGLQDGERVVTSGQLRLVPGAKVKVVTGGTDGKETAGS